MKLFSYLLMFFLLNGFLWSLSNDEVIYQLKVSEAYNALSKNDYVKAGKIAKTLERNQERFGIHNKILHADVFFILGEIHYHSKLYSTAIDYYEKANEIFTTFILPVDHKAMLWKMVYSYQHLKKENKSIATISQILSLGEEQSQLRQPPPSWERGRAYYHLAHLFQNLDKQAAMYEYLLKAIQNNYQKYNAYLFLLHYLATTTQDKINQDFELYFGEESIDDREIPQRTNVFLYYHRLWRELPSNPNDKENFDEIQKIYRYSDYDNIIYQINRFIKELKSNVEE